MRFYRNIFKRASRVLLLILPLSLLACSTSEMVRTTQIIATGDTTSAMNLVRQKAVRYALNPKALEWDIKVFKKRLNAFHDAVDKVWGRQDRKESTPQRYVKYTGDYKSRAMVDFDAGQVTVETVDQKTPSQSLISAVTATVLAPADPRSVDLWSASEITLGKEPFLYGEVKDFEGQDMRWEWRAKRFAQTLVARGVATRTTQAEGDTVTVRSVSFPLVRDHLEVRAAKYASVIRTHAKAYKVSENLVYAIIKTESDFNPFAVSSAPAFGLMQIVPSTAGADVTQFLTGQPGQPSKELLFQADKNIRYGTAYLHLLDSRHLQAIRSPTAREYCMIASYNGGSGMVLNSFDRDRSRAAARINAMSPGQVYAHLRTQLPANETRRYLEKVVTARKQFTGVGRIQ